MPPRKKGSEDALNKLAVEAAPNAILVVDSAGLIVLVNAQTEKLFGYSRKELLGKKMEILVPQRYRGAHAGHRTGFFSNPSARAMGAGRDLYGQRKDGGEVPIEIGLNPIDTPEGRFVLASIIDITVRRDMERKLQHTEVLAAIGSMVAVVAHEIRNPLGSVSMAAKALARGGLSPEDQAQVLSVLDSESRRLNQTITDFLHYARPREPKLQLSDINAAAHEVLSAMKTDASASGKIVVKEVLDETLPRLPFDADQMRQVLWNLIRNAFQALDGKGKLEVRTELVGGKVAVRIRDTGPGIAPEQLEKLFTPFFTTKAQGTGLGLSIARNIVRSHGGDLQVESEPGRGTEFTMLLPMPR